MRNILGYAVLSKEDRKYVQGRYFEVVKFIDNEVRGLIIVSNYEAASGLLNMLPKRIKLVVDKTLQATKGKSREGISEQKLERMDNQRNDYLNRLSKILKERSKDYSPSMGSFWEDLSKRLEGLAEEVKIL